MLWHEVDLDLRSASDDVVTQVRYVLNSARHDFPARARLTLTVHSSRHGHHVHDGARELGVADSPRAVLNLLYAQIYGRAYALAAGAGWVRLHAAVVDGASSRAVVVAAAGTGKTTLSCALLSAGVAVAGDESLWIRDGIGIPVARRFHLRSDTESLVADIAGCTHELPQIRDGATRAFDPGEAGFEWRIRRRRIDQVILLRRGTTSLLRPHSAIATTPDIVEQMFAHGEAPSVRFAQAAALLRTARCWTLDFASVPDATTQVCRLLDASVCDRSG